MKHLMPYLDASDFLFVLAKHSKFDFADIFIFFFLFLRFHRPKISGSISGPSYQISISDGFLIIENAQNNKFTLEFQFLSLSLLS
jgi:hypothetical protein